MGKAVVLLSGGLDSTVTLAYALSVEEEVVALSFRYGQRHSRELEAARNVVKHYRLKEHYIVNVDLSAYRSALTSSSVPVPKRASVKEIGSDIPVTYVPARNIIFLSIAAGLCESVDADTIYIGANALDYSGYPDCRPEFVRAFEGLANVATRAGVEGTRFRVHTPLIQLSKADIIRRGIRLGLDFGLTHSCYDPGPSGRPCGHCDSCALRAKGFAEAGVADPLLLR